MLPVLNFGRFPEMSPVTNNMVPTEVLEKLLEDLENQIRELEARAKEGAETEAQV